MTRLQQLRNRREKLISLNAVHHYTETDHPKILKYYRVLLWNNKLINEIEQRNVRPANARVGLTAKDLRMLTENLN